MKNNLDNLDDSNEWHLWTQMPYVHYKKQNDDKDKGIQLSKLSIKKKEKKARADGQKKNNDLSSSYDESLYAKGKKENQKEKI